MTHLRYNREQSYQIKHSVMIKVFSMLFNKGGASYLWL